MSNLIGKGYAHSGTRVACRGSMRFWLRKLLLMKLRVGVGVAFASCVAHWAVVGYVATLWTLTRHEFRIWRVPILIAISF